MAEETQSRLPSYPRWSIFTQRSMILPAVIVLLAVAARTLPGPRIIDDSYITYRYTRNILAGNGFEYNPGEHVLGTTTPLYTILLAVMGIITGGTQAPLANLSVLLNTAADCLTCLLLLRLGRQLGSSKAGTGAALAWAVAPFSVTFAIGGLETSLYVLLLTALVSVYLERHWVLTGVLAALSFLTRPDALILLGLLAIDQLIRLWLAHRKGTSRQLLRSILREATTFFALVLPWIVFAMLTFGSPLPHSIAAKSLAYRLPGDAALVRLLQHYATPFLEHLTFGIPWIAVGLVLYPFLCILGVRHAMRNNAHIWTWAAFPWLYFAIFALANPLIFRWYMTPPLPALYLMSLIGLEQFIYQFRTATKGESPNATQTTSPLRNALALIFVVLAPAALSLRGWVLHPDHGADRPAPEMAFIQLELLYRQVADTLAPEIAVQPDVPVLAAGDVGVLGFYSGAHILDTVGLNSTISTAYYPLDPALYAINYAIPPDLILDQQPDYVVILEVYGRLGLLKDARFVDAYSLRKKIPTDIYGSDGMLIFERKP